REVRLGGEARRGAGAGGGQGEGSGVRGEAHEAGAEDAGARARHDEERGEEREEGDAGGLTMRLARVLGPVWGARHAAGLDGAKLLALEPLEARPAAGGVAL